MQIQIDPQPILSRPSQHPQNILPTDPLQEWLRHRLPTRIHTHVFPRLHRPERYGDPNPIQTGAGDLRDIFFGDEGVVVVFEGLLEVGAEESGQGPFVVGCAVEGLVECGRDEGFEDEEAAEVDTEVRVGK